MGEVIFLLQKKFLLLKTSVLFFLDAASMTDESYDILDELEESKRICKLTNDTVNTFIFFEEKLLTYVALSNLKMHTYANRLEDNSPYIRL